MLCINFHGVYPDWRSWLLWVGQGFRYTHVSISIVCTDDLYLNYDWTIGGMRRGEGDMPGILKRYYLDIPHSSLYDRLQDVSFAWNRPETRLTWWRFLLTVLRIKRYPLCTDFVLYILGATCPPHPLNCNQLETVVKEYGTCSNLL